MALKPNQPKRGSLRGTSENKTAKTGRKAPTGQSKRGATKVAGAESRPRRESARSPATTTRSAKSAEHRSRSRGPTTGSAELPPAPVTQVATRSWGMRARGGGPEGLDRPTRRPTSSPLNVQAGGRDRSSLVHPVCAPHGAPAGT
jgi:hypothetical protein